MCITQKYQRSYQNMRLHLCLIKEKLKESYIVPFQLGTMHEFVISAKNQKDKGLKVEGAFKLYRVSDVKTLNGN